MSVRRLLLAAALLTPNFFVDSIAVHGDEAKVDASSQVRKAYRDERPDDSRGWMIVTKASYWPLCYEAMDRLQEVRDLIGKSQPDQMGEALVKSAAWLRLANSAAIVDSPTEVTDVVDSLDDAAEMLNDKSTWTDEKLTDLVTLANLAMAKSHVFRSQNLANGQRFERTNAIEKEPATKVLKLIDNKIRQARVERDVAQYRYDASQSQRHLVVAQKYLEAAAETGGFKLDKTATESVPAYSPTLDVSDLGDYVSYDLKEFSVKLLEVIDSHRKRYREQLDLE